MNKGLIIALSIMGLLLIVGLGIAMWGVGIYNGLVKQDEQINQAWAQVENQYQRRSDLIPNLVETVKGFAKQEREVLEGVINARARATGITISPETLKDPEAFQRYQQAQDGIQAALSRLLMLQENYPQLRSNENFMKLQDELAGTENRIAVERRRFNEVITAFNTRIRMFPSSIIAGMTGFSIRPYFEAREGAENAPNVSF